MTASTTVAPPIVDQTPSSSHPLLRLPQSYPPLVRATLIRGTALAVFLLVWWAITAAKLIDPLFLPSPKAVWEAFVRANTWHEIAPGVPREVLGEQNYFLWEHLIASLQRILAGVGLAILIGPPLGFLMGTVRPVAIALEPYLNFLRALPPLGYIGLLIVWFGIGDTSKIWLLFLAAFPAITISTLGGVQAIPVGLTNAAASLGASRWHTVWHVIFPASLPSVINGIRLAVGFAWTTVVAAELNNGIPGIGGLAFYAGQQTNTALTIACIIVIGLTALALDAAIKYLGQLATPWQGKA